MNRFLFLLFISNSVVFASPELRISAILGLPIGGLEDEIKSATVLRTSLFLTKWKGIDLGFDKLYIHMSGMGSGRYTVNSNHLGIVGEWQAPFLKLRGLRNSVSLTGGEIERKLDEGKETGLLYSFILTDRLILFQEDYFALSIELLFMSSRGHPIELIRDYPRDIIYIFQGKETSNLVVIGILGLEFSVF